VKTRSVYFVKIVFGMDVPGSDAPDVGLDEQWRPVNIVDFSLSSTEICDKLFASAIEELKSLLSRCLQNMGGYSLEKVIDHFMGTHSVLVNKLFGRMQRGLRQHGKPELTDGEIYSFLEGILSCQIYNKSPTCLYDDIYQLESLRPIRSLSIECKS
jgi:hypothetical protein